ncbi:DUF475 domain-containing protein [Catenulispora subtropica]|uniref:DUF475 domain-containing protein n=1 Tax=Catenulispora subtropica TaxID=450798 RepID=A0ABN2QQX3_9ACTN
MTAMDTVGRALLLAAVEVSLSFDNAVVNATVLRRLSAFWQRLFLTVGMLIAVVGMRLLFPLLVVAISARLSPVGVLHLATADPHAYDLRLASARPEISAFGGAFLLMVFLDFLFTERDLTWLRPLERLSARISRLDRLAPAIALGALLATALVGQHPESQVNSVLAAGLLGIIAHLLISGLSGLAEHGSAEDGVDRADGADPTDGADRKGSAAPAPLRGRDAFFAFCFLELMDASFSFDGVIGAFAFTSNLFVIAVGLGIGALAVRSLTVHLVRRGTLTDFVYLEHGAHYAIGLLGTLLLATAYGSLPQLLSGLLGLGVIGTSLASSVVRNRRLTRSPV